ncbi:hypothetical protein MFUL124B02_17710 [Myxococcus fulvus 124B02]|nr:hypothetical protein MFUL124B02_17710 [Myxococcus fulvus 124B02]
MRSLLFSLLFLSPSLVLASSEGPGASEAPPPQWAPSASPQEAAPSAESTALAVLHTSARIAVELGALSVTSLAMGVPGLAVGSASCQNHSGVGACIDEAASGFLVGATVGAPIGIMWGAHLLGGKGTWGGTLLGAGVGAGTGTVVSLLLVEKGEFVIVPSVALVGSVLGSFVGYELSHAANSAPPAPSDVHMQPLVAVSQGGMTLGLGGRF